jgi:hypothetical protein
MRVLVELVTDLMIETGLFGRVVASSSTVVLVTVLVMSNNTVVMTKVTALMLIVEREVLVTTDWEVRVVKTVEVVVVKTKVDTNLVDGIRVVLITVAIAKLVNTVWVFVKTLYLATSVVLK